MQISALLRKRYLGRNVFCRFFGLFFFFTKYCVRTKSHHVHTCYHRVSQYLITARTTLHDTCQISLCTRTVISCTCKILSGIILCLQVLTIRTYAPYTYKILLCTYKKLSCTYKTLLGRYKSSSWACRIFVPTTCCIRYHFVHTRFYHVPYNILPGTCTIFHVYIQYYIIKDNPTWSS